MMTYKMVLNEKTPQPEFVVYGITPCNHEYLIGVIGDPFGKCPVLLMAPPTSTIGLEGMRFIVTTLDQLRNEKGIT